jgi:hypothetical protein
VVNAIKGLGMDQKMNIEHACASLPNQAAVDDCWSGVTKSRHKVGQERWDSAMKEGKRGGNH